MVGKKLFLILRTGYKKSSFAKLQKSLLKLDLYIFKCLAEIQVLGEFCIFDYPKPLQIKAIKEAFIVTHYDKRTSILFK